MSVLRQFIYKAVLLLVTVCLQVIPLFAQRTDVELTRPTFDSSQVVVAVIDTLYQGTNQNTQMHPQIAQSASIFGYTLDKNRIVGDIPYQLGTTEAGQFELAIPIETFASEFEYSPQLMIKYNSQDGLNCMGSGWAISGLSCIEPVNKIFYTDGNSSAKDHINGPWALDGNRLILHDVNDTTEVHLTQTGNFKVVRSLNGSGNFRVFLPNGTINDYCFSSGNGIKWHLSTSTSIDGNTLRYSYYDDGNVKLIKSVEFGQGRSLDFIYEDASDEHLCYIDGIPIIYRKKLTQIDVKCQESLLRQYIMSYRNDDIAAPLIQVDLLDSAGNAVNPLHFYYQGDNAAEGSDSLVNKQMFSYFDFQDPDYYIAFRGKLDFGYEDDAVIVYPNKRNYYIRQQDRIRNDYDANDQLVFNFDLNGYASSSYILNVGEGFVDAFCMNVDTQSGEEFVKVNQKVTNSHQDHVQFNIYKHTIYGLLQTDTVDIYLDDLVCDGHHSVWPSRFLTGDFTGDGKEEVLLCRTSSPLGGGEMATVKMIDLEHHMISYSGQLDALNLYVYDNHYNPSQNIERARNSNRLFATDLDGDGKLEMCILNSSGLDIYHFNYSASGNIVMTKSNYSGLRLSQVHDYDVTVGELNGDGNSDLLLLPNVKNLGIKAYISNGNGGFTYQSIGIQSDDATSMMCFDYNQDGLTDIVRYVKSSYMKTSPNWSTQRPYTLVYSLKGSAIVTTYNISRTEPSILVPMSLFGQSSNTAMLSLKAGGLYDIHRCSNPKNMDALMVGVADSRGRIAQMQYQQLFHSGYYTPNFNADFPFMTFAGNVFVCSRMTKSSGDNTYSDVSHRYSDATIHRQGLGFCGFRSITATDLLRNEVTVQTFSPETFGALVSVTSPRENRGFINQSVVSDDKRVKVLTTGETRTDLITGIVSTSDYTHDPYGNVLTAVTSADGWTKTITNTYHNINNDSTWIIGLEAMRTETVSHNDSSVTNGRTTRYNPAWLPDTVITWRNTGQNAVSTRTVEYDNLNRPIIIKTRPYNGTELKRHIFYTGDGRVPTGTVDEKNMYHHVAYGDFGITTSSLSPNLLNLVNIDSLSLNPLGPRGGLEGQNEVNGGGGSTFIEPLLPVLQNISASYHYDPLGRQDSVSYSDGTGRNASCSWAGEECPSALIMEESLETGHPASRVWTDAQGRKVRTSTQRFDGSWSNVFYEYDELGRLSRESMPTLGASPSKWTTYTYDSFDRVIEKEYPDGHSDTFSYNGLSTTSTTDGTTSTRTLDAVGNLVEVNDGGGRIEYTLRPDGLPSEVRVGGVIATTFEYDQYGRRTAINDPSAGRRTTAYDGNGNVSCETDARGQSIMSTYNAIGQMTAMSSSDGQSVTFAYDRWNALVSMTAANGHTKSWSYNNDRRLASETVDGFKKMFTYEGNQVSSVGYSLNNAYICGENYTRSNGHLTAITLNTGDTIWTLRKQNARFLPTKVGTGKMERTFVYDDRGHATTRLATRAGGSTVQNLIESYEDGTGNMSYRVDWIHDIWDTFDYDGMNRLTEESTSHYGNSPLGCQETLYDGKGNILLRTDPGEYSYSASLPYAVSGLTPSVSSSVPMREQYLHFNAMQLPDTISENGYTATFSYHGDRSRAGMTVTGSAGYQFSCDYYDHRYNEFSKTEGNVTSHKSVLWLGGTPYSAPAALLKDYGQNTWQVVHVLRDNLGSITHVIDTTGTVLQEMGYSAWGQLRNPQTGTVYGPDNQPELLLGRGYTGHEHLPWFGLINMNARLYDPAVGRFLSPDPIVQTPDNTQNFNRYAYCMNNPLRYADPLGGAWTEYLDYLSEIGEIIRIHRILDEVVITETGGSVVENSPSTGLWGSDGYNSGIYGYGWGYDWYSGRQGYTPYGAYDGHSFNYAGCGSSNGSTSIHAPYLPQYATSHYSVNSSTVLNFTSNSASYFSYLTQDSKATFAWGKFDDLYELRISKAGNDWIYGKKATSVAKVGKNLLHISNALGLGAFFIDAIDSYDAFQRKDYKICYHKGVDAFMDAVSLIPCVGPIPLILSVTWALGKDQFWKFVDDQYDEILYK